MKTKSILLIAAAFCSCGLSHGQTLEQAKKWFTEGNFEEAKPVFAKVVKQSPANASYNFWYGACCFETGEYAASQPYLEKAAKRDVINAFLYLGKLYYKMYRFDDAVENVETHIEWLEKKKRDTTEAEHELARCRRAARMIHSVENVTVVDSFVVGKSSFLSAYRLSKEVGEVAFMQEGGGHTQFTSEMGDKKIYSLTDSEGHSKLWSQTKLIDKWGHPEELSSLNGRADDLGYPFMESDGTTLYYAAKSDETLGGYDIFMTRYDMEDNIYLRPTNIGMPFNSTANDYMYAIDDFNGLGWFASDRFQPEDSVCIYVFVPNEQKISYDYDNTDPGLMICLASLQSIRATWTDADIMRQGKQQLAMTTLSKDAVREKNDFEFVISDHRIYTKLADFRSREAGALFQQLLKKQSELADLQGQLEKQRETFAKTSKTGQAQMKESILIREKQELQLLEEISALALSTRRTENEFINGR